MPESKVKSLLAHEVDPRKALLSIDLETIDSVSALDQEKRFVLFVCLFVCLSAYLCLSVCLSVCLTLLSLYVLSPGPMVLPCTLLVGFMTLLLTALLNCTCGLPV